MRRFKALLLATGVPFSLIGGLFFVIIHPHGWVLAIIGAMLAGGGYALIMTAIAYAFTKFARFSGCSSILLVSLMSITGITCGGGMGLAGGLMADKWLPKGKWVKLDDSFKRPVEILGAPVSCYPGIFIRTAEGSIFLCDSFPQTGCTEMTLSPEELAKIENQNCRDLIDPPVPVFPGKVVDFYESEYVPEVIIQYNHVVLEDGSVWQWVSGGPFFAIFSLLGLGIVGLLIGLGVSIFMARRNWKV